MGIQLRVKSSRGLGLNLDMCLKWREHIEELQLSYVKKLNLLKAMRFLPRQMLNDFYWKVVYPAVTYGIVIWENCNATQFKALEKMHARAARIVHGLDWNMQTEQVLAKTNWKTLESTYKLRLLCLAHKFYNGQATKQICEAMIMKPRSHHYNLRDQITTTRPTTNYLLK